MQITAATLPADTLLYILLGAFLCILLLLTWVIRLEIKLRRFTVGRSGRSLEESIDLLKENYRSATDFRSTTLCYLETVEDRLRRSIQGIETVRFNPFHNDGSGGSQSFATALLNEAGDGVVFSSIYARDRMCVFAKPVKHFVSEHELSEEEREAIKNVRATLPTKGPSLIGQNSQNE